MPLLHLIILAIIQGVTEFLPVSSSAHLILFPALTGTTDQGPIIDVAVHLGTLLAVMLYFHSDVRKIFFGAGHLLKGRTTQPEARFALPIMALALSGAAMALVAQSLRLPMMPMRLDDVLLPGETSRLLLKEPAHLALLDAVEEKHDGQFGQLLQENGRCGSVAPILKIEAHAPPTLLFNDGLCCPDRMERTYRARQDQSR